jgi:hypothetical protein
MTRRPQDKKDMPIQDKTRQGKTRHTTVQDARQRTHDKANDKDDETKTMTKDTDKTIIHYRERELGREREI